MKFCCLCGESIDVGDYFVTVRQNRLVRGPNGNEVPVRVSMEDGTFEKNAHAVCPSMYGAPLALVGADGNRSDV